MSDGIVLANIAAELEQIKGGRIDKIYQPNKHEIILTVRANNENKRLLLSANSAAPKIHFTEEKFENPQNPPMFCVLCRKHLRGRITEIVQPNFERIIEIGIESSTELGDIKNYRLIAEIMGKHSNIILVDEKNSIIDAIKHVPHYLSSVRPILQGLNYIPPPDGGKINFLHLSKENFDPTGDLPEALYKTYTGLSPLMAKEIFARTGFSRENLYSEMMKLKEQIINKDFLPQVILDKNNQIDFTSVDMMIYNNYDKKIFLSISEAIEYFYIERTQNYRVSQKTADLKKIVKQNISRCVKKSNKFLNQLKEIENRDKLRVYGDLILANLHMIEGQVDNFTAENFYNDMEEIIIPLDKDLTPSQNAQKYFKEFNRQKRAYTATIEQKEQNETDLKYLEGILLSLERNLTEQELEEIREELVEEKILKKRGKNKKSTASAPLKFISTDGFLIYVGKNNKQNETLTFQSGPLDIWLHTKDIPGSHVIIKTQNREVPLETITQAASLAAYYSKAQNSSIVPVDYTLRKYVKKTKGAKPGMVIYQNHKTAFVNPKLIGGKE